MRIIIKKLLSPGDTLSQRVIRSTFWVAFYKIVERVLRFIKTMVIARLLVPSDFGLFGIACLALETLKTFTDTGINYSLIQKKEDIKDYLNTAWTIQIIRSTVIFLIILVFSPVIGRFFNNTQSVPLMKVVALTMLLSGFTNIGIVYFAKDIEFIKQRLLNFSQLIVEFIVSIILALVMRNAWALVWGILAGAATNCIASYIFHPYRPKLHLEIKKAKELLHFGKWIFASVIIVFVSTQGDSILVGKIAGTTALGLYALAYGISNMAATEITHIISQILFPAYSKIQSDTKKLKEVYFKTLSLVSSITVPLTILIISLGHDFTKVFLGNKWLPMVNSLQFLAIAGFIRSIVAVGGALFSGIGRPDLDFKMNAYRMITLAVLIFPAVKFFSIDGASICVVLSILATIPVWLWNSIMITKSSYRDIVSIFIPALMSSVIMLIIIYSIKNANAILSLPLSIFTFLPLVILSVFIYLSTVYFFGKIFKIGPLAIVKSLRLDF